MLVEFAKQLHVCEKHAHGIALEMVGSSLDELMCGIWQAPEAGNENPKQANRSRKNAKTKQIGNIVKATNGTLTEA